MDRSTGFVTAKLGILVTAFILGNAVAVSPCRYTAYNQLQDNLCTYNPQVYLSIERTIPTLSSFIVVGLN